MNGRPSTVQTPVIEEWKPIVGYDGLYEITPTGRICSVGGLVKYIDGRTRIYPRRELKPSISSNGYRLIRLQDINRVIWNEYVHRLVMLTFVGPCPEGMEVRHLDGNRLNANLSNLQYGTAKENAADKKLHGTELSGLERHTTKVTREMILGIRADYDTHTMTLREIADKYGTNYETVRRIGKRMYWADIKAEGGSSD